MAAEEYAIFTDSLSKSFGKGLRQVTAVRGVNLAVAPGQVYGFLGPNGAGKTTTIRMLMNLIRPSGGTARIFGQPVQSGPAALRRVGALVEGPAFYNYLNGWENLEVVARTAACYDAARIRFLMETLGLAERGKRPVSSFSLGMKQRLGIAAALLSDPDMLILDEPTNGLDPAGIQEIRALIRNLADEQGKTVFVSSHLLNEVEQICDRVAIIYNGEIIREGEVRALLSDSAEEIAVQATPSDSARALLEQTWPVRVEGEWLVAAAPKEAAPEIVSRLVAAGVAVHQVVQRRQTLEEYFMAVTHTPGEQPHA